jgi:hypothetical protein
LKWRDIERKKKRKEKKKRDGEESDHEKWRLQTQAVDGEIGGN